MRSLGLSCLSLLALTACAANRPPAAPPNGRWAASWLETTEESTRPSPSTTAGPAVAEGVPDRFVGLIVSGGHTTLVGVERGRVSSLAETRDDAIGEAFDKLGKRMGLPYPQGPVVDELAERGRAERFPLPVPSPGERPYFSYSGLKTQTLSALQALESRRGRRLDERGPEEPLPDEAIDLLAGFRAAAVRQLLDRLERLHRRDRFEILAVSGGVAANRLLRRELAPRKR